MPGSLQTLAHGNDHLAQPAVPGLVVEAPMPQDRLPYDRGLAATITAAGDAVRRPLLGLSSTGSSRGDSNRPRFALVSIVMLTVLPHPSPGPRRGHRAGPGVPPTPPRARRSHHAGT